MSQLHETLFARTTDSTSIAGTFLERDRSQEDRRNWRGTSAPCIVAQKWIEFTPEFGSKLLECPNMLLAGTEGAALSDGVVEVHGNEIIDVDEGRVPTSALNTAV